MLPKRADHATSKFKGVTYIKKKKVYRARIEKDGESHFLGDYATEEQAAQAYNRAARDLFGDIAYQNRLGKLYEQRKKAS